MRVALACLLMVAFVPGAAVAEPIAEVTTYDQGGGNCCTTWTEYCMDASIEAASVEHQLFCVNRDQFVVGGADANPYLDPATHAVDPEALLTEQLGPDLRTTRWTVVEDASTVLPNPLNYDPFYLMRSERSLEEDCVHLVDGAPGQGPEPFQSICVRAGTLPYWPFGNVTVLPRNVVGGINNVSPAAEYRVDVTVEFTYDCTQMEDTMASLGDGSEGEPFLPFYLPFRPFVSEGLGAATHPESTTAVIEVRLEDGLGEVAESRTSVPGAGQAIGYALFAQQELDGGSELCA